VVTGSTGRPALLSLTLLAVVAVSLAAAPGPDGLLGAFLGALMLAIAASDFQRHNNHSEPSPIGSAEVAIHNS